MFSRILTTKSIGNYSEQIKKLKNEIETADAIVVGAGAGLCVPVGFTVVCVQFLRYIVDF